MRPFNTYSLIKGHEEKDGEWYFHAPPALMDAKDFDGHILRKAGVMNGLEHWKHHRQGAFDYQHKWRESRDLDKIVGYHHGDTEIDGVPHVVGRLLKSKGDAQKIWRHLQDGGKLGLSIEGVAKKVDPQHRHVVLDTEIHLITIDPFPKGFDGVRIRPGLPPTMMQLAKSLSANLESGDLSDWFEVEDDLSYEPIDDMTGTPLEHLRKAITSGGAVSSGPGATSFLAARQDYVVGQKTGGKTKTDQWGVQVRCTSCNCKNAMRRVVKEGKCRNCGHSMKAEKLRARDRQASKPLPAPLRD